MKSVMDVLYNLLRFLGLLDEPAPPRQNIKRNRVYDDFSSDDETPVLGYKQVKKCRWSDIALNDNHDKDVTHSNDVRNVPIQLEGSYTTSTPKDSPMRVVPVNLSGLSRNGTSKSVREPSPAKPLIDAEIVVEQREPTVGSKSEKTQKKSLKLLVDLDEDDSDGNQQDDDVVFVEEVTTPPTSPLKHNLTKDNCAEILSKILEELKPDETLDYQELLQIIATSKKPKAKTKPVGDGTLTDATSFRLPQKIQVNVLNEVKLDNELNAGTQNAHKEHDPVRISSSDSSDSDVEEVPPQSSTSSVKKGVETESRNRLLELDSKYNKVSKTQDKINDARRVSDITSKDNSDQNIVRSPRADKTDRSEVLLSELGSKYNIKLCSHTCVTSNKPETQNTQEKLNDSQKTAIFTPNANSELNEARASSSDTIDEWLAKLDAKYFSKPKPNDIQPNAAQSSKLDIAGNCLSKLESKYKTDQLKSQAKLSGAVPEPENISKENTQLDATKKWLAKLEAQYFSSPQKTQDNLSNACHDSNIVPKLNNEQDDVLIVESKYEDLPKSQDQRDGLLRQSDIAKENSETNEARLYLPATAKNWLSKLDAEYKTDSANQADNKARQGLKNTSKLNVEPSEPRPAMPASIDVWLAELKSRLNGVQPIRQDLNDTSRESETVAKVSSEKSEARSEISDTAGQRLSKLDSEHKTEQPKTQIILDDTYQEVNDLSNGNCERNNSRSFRFNTSEDLMMKLGSLYRNYHQEPREKNNNSSEQKHKHKKSRGEDRNMEMQSNGDFELPDLTPEQEKLVVRALQPDSEDEMLVEKFNLRIHRRDLRTLSDENWLNDEVINFYMNLIMQRSQERKDLPEVYATNTFFYSKLMQSGQAGLRRWTRKVDIFAYDLFMVPVNIDRHWCLILVNFRTHVITYLDSRGRPNQECLDALLQYLKDEHQDKKGAPFDDSGWKTECPTNIPQQMNGSDCGMFACTFAEFSSRDAAYSFTQAHMPYLRRKAALEILQGKLLL